MAPAPKVTIIVATYNWSAVLPFSVGSALDQSFADFELIVVGDGCSDDSAEVVAAIGDARIRWVNLPENSGHQSAPNNEGLRQARGALIAYLGHDDLWLPHHLECIVGAIDAGADMAFGLTRIVPAAPGPEPHIVGGPFQPDIWVPPTSVVHRRALTERCGGWRGYRELGVDPEVDLWARFHAAGARIRPISRLTALKLPAALRRGVYRARPSHEQAAWLARIRAEPDFEQTELAGMLLAATRRSFGALLGAVLRRIGIRARGAWLRAKGRPRPGEQVERRRRDKGLVPARAAPGGME